jgi:uncharacterized surface protein with fasciclin (FAS1) repeats
MRIRSSSGVLAPRYSMRQPLRLSTMPKVSSAMSCSSPGTALVPWPCPQPWVKLADALSNAQNITVFAPTNEAFAKIPQETLAKVLADKKSLTDILTYHVVEQSRAPSDLEGATLTTLQGGTISTAKSGDTYTVNDARVLCGNVQTRNATVYLIDTVLIPKN